MSQSVAKLKELLFAPENEAIAALASRIDGVFDRAGTQERFQASVALALEGALREADVARHDEVARAIAPLIVRTVKGEITNSTDELVEALYPATGRMVRAYVASAIKDLSEEINRRLETNPVMAGLGMGRSAGDLAIANSQRLRVDDVFLIRRATGELVARWPAGADGSANLDHVLGGVLTAINEFTAEAFKAEGSALRQIDLGDSRVYLRVSPIFLLATKCSGTAHGPAEQAIDDEFLDLIAQRGMLDDGVEAAAPHQNGGGVPAHGTPTAPLLEQLAHRLEARLLALAPKPRARRLSPLAMLALLVGLPLLALLVWNASVDFALDTVETRARAQVAAEPAMEGYPSTIQGGDRGREVTVSGLAPSPSVKDAVIARIKAALPRVAVKDRLNAVVAGTIDPGPLLADLRADQLGLETRLAAQRSRRTLDAAAADLEQAATVMATAAPTDTRLTRETRALSQTLRDQPDRGGTADALTGPAQRLAALVADLDRRLGGSNAVAAAGTAARAPIDAATPEFLGALANHVLSSARAFVVASDLRTTLERQSSAMEASLADVPRQVQAAVDARPVPRPIQLPPVVASSPRADLEHFVRERAIFFADNAVYRNEVEATRCLDELAPLMKRSGAFVRIVGYTDEAGTPAKNIAIAKMRAEAVAAALFARGIDRTQVVALFRVSAETRVSPVNGTGSANRRVEFEVGFQGEGGP